MSTGQGAVVFTDDTTLLSREREYNDRPQAKPVVDAITSSLGATFYKGEQKFDFLRQPVIGRKGLPDPSIEGDRFTFSRWYPECRVLIDMIPVDTDKARKLVDQKRAVISEYNKKVVKQGNKELKMGYLPVLVYQRVHFSTFEAAKAHKVLELPERTAAEQKMMLERGIVR